MYMCSSYRNSTSEETEKLPLISIHIRMQLESYSLHSLARSETSKLELHFKPYPICNFTSICEITQAVLKAANKKLHSITNLIFRSASRRVLFMVVAPLLLCLLSCVVMSDTVNIILPPTLTNRFWARSLLSVPTLMLMDPFRS